MCLELTSKNVQETVGYCLFKEGEDTSNSVLVEGIQAKFGFHPKRLEDSRSKICEMLSQLPSNSFYN